MAELMNFTDDVLMCILSCGTPPAVLRVCKRIRDIAMKSRCSFMQGYVVDETQTYTHETTTDDDPDAYRYETSPTYGLLFENHTHVMRVERSFTTTNMSKTEQLVDVQWHSWVIMREGASCEDSEDSEDSEGIVCDRFQVQFSHYAHNRQRVLSIIIGDMKCTASCTIGVDCERNGRDLSYYNNCDPPYYSITEEEFQYRPLFAQLTMHFRGSTWTLDDLIEEMYNPDSSVLSYNNY